MTKRDWWNFIKGMAFISPWLIGFVLFMALPIALSFYYSLTDYPLFQPPVFIGTDNYERLFTGDALFWKTLWNTVYYTLLSLPATMLISLGLALLLNARIANQSIYRTIIFIPSIVPIMASAMLWLVLMNPDTGVFNGLLNLVGLDGIGWLTDKRWAMPSLAFMSLWGVGYTVVIYLAGLQDVPTSLYEAAEIDGAGVWSRMWNVTLPFISPVIFFNLIMAIIGTLQVFLQPFVMTKGGPDDSTRVYTMYLYQTAFEFQEFGYASAMAWVQLLIILVLTGIAFWSSKRWVHYQGE